MSTTTKAPGTRYGQTGSVGDRPGPGHGIRAAWIMLASGWSANQFSALLGAYRSDLDLAESAVTGLFALYVVGLIPGLLVGGPLADRIGRRPVALTALALNLLSTVLLMLGAGATGWLAPGRFLTGVSAGALLAAGSAWIKELASAAAAPPATAARRAGLFVSAGFATGGLAAALIARWAPAPMVTAYVPHVLLAVGAGLAALRAPETREATASGTARRGSGGVGKRFRRGVLPVTPWVFAAPTVGFVTLPGLVHGGLVYAGVATAVTPGAGLLIQPVARRLAARHRLATALAGLMTIAAGLALAAVSAAAEEPAPALAAAAVLGAGYGLVLTFGLTEVTALAPPHRLARLTAYFWAAAYTGMLTPYALTLLSDVAAPPTLLAVLAALAVLTCAALPALNSRAGDGGSVSAAAASAASPRSGAR
ncbi:MFS transporter [Streptomyces sp. NPDC059002]|uniref:MFS transporter n=1 Tax=Streptomyces sp. NPDC059002 TaxID=3346690 RepID=UPI00368B1487